MIGKGRFRVTTRLAIAFATLGVWFAACGDRPDSLVEDHNDGDRLGRLTVEATVDGYAADLVPFLPAGIATTASGTLFLSQPQDFTIRVFDSDGNQIGQIGRDGEGPGEFRAVMRLGVFADSLWVWDGRLRRISIFSLNHLQYVRSIRAPAALDAAGTNGPIHLDGFAVVTLLDRDEFVALGDDGTRSVLARSSSAGTDGQILAVLLGGDEVRRIRSGTTIMDADQFPSMPFFAVSPDRERVVRVKAHLEGDQANTFNVLVLTQAGDTVFFSTYPFEPERIPRSVADSVIEARSAGLPGPLAAAFRSQAYVPPAYPPLTGLTVGWDGSIWIRLRDSANSVTYSVVSPSGTPLGETVLSAGETVVAVGTDFVWTMSRDSLDIQSLHRYARER